MTPERLEEIRKRAEAATPGPWQVDDPPVGYLRIIGGVDGDVYDDGSMKAIYTIVCDIHEDDDEQVNASFIANARQDIPDLLAALDDALARIAELERMA